VKQYYSTYTHLGIEDDIEVLDKQSLNLAKKKLLAEIDLSPTHTILRGRKEMTKDDVLKAFDALPTDEQWRFHRIISQDSRLLAFLEDNKLERGDKIESKPEYENTDFITFVSPYYAHSFLKIILECLEKRQPNRMDTLVYDNPFLMTDQDAEFVWSKVEQFLNDKIETLELMTEQVKKSVKFSDKEVIGFHTPSMMECLNLLPKDDFDWIRDRYALAMYNFSANTWNAGLYYRAIDFVRQAQILVLSDHEQQLIDERIAFFENEILKMNEGNQSNSSSDSWGSSRPIFWIIFILFQIFRHGCTD
jgi:hypothetical protein